MLQQSWVRALLLLLIFCGQSGLYVSPAVQAQTETVHQNPGSDVLSLSELEEDRLSPTVARELLDQLHIAAREMQYQDQQATVLLAIVSSYHRLSDDAMASAVMSEVMEKIDHTSDSLVLLRVLRSLEQFTDKSKRVAWLNQLLDIVIAIENDLNRTYLLDHLILTIDNVIAEQVLVDNLIGRAMEASVARPTGRAKSDELLAFAHFYNGRSDSMMAAQILNQSFSAAGVIDNDNSKIALLYDRFLLVDQLPDAALNQTLLDQIFGVANTFEHEAYRLYALTQTMTLADRMGHRNMVQDIWYQSLAIVDTVSDTRRQTSVLREIIDGYGQLSDDSLLKDGFRYILQAIETVQSSEKRLSLLTAAIEVAVTPANETVSRKNLSQAMAMVNQLPDGWSKAHSLIALARGYGQLSDEATTQSLLNQALAMMDANLYDYSHQKVTMDFMTATIMLSDQAIGQQLLKRCLTILNAMDDKERLAHTLFTFAENYGQQNDDLVYTWLNQALATIETMEQPSTKMNILRRTVEYLTFTISKTGTVPNEMMATALLQQVLTDAHGLEEEIGNTRFFDSVAYAVIHLSDENNVNILLEQLLMLSHRSQDPGFKVSVSVAIAKIYASLGDESTAQDWLNDALIVGQTVDNEGIKIATMAGMKTTYDLFSDATAVEDWLSQWLSMTAAMQQEHQKSSGLNIIAAAADRLSDERAIRPLVNDVIEISQTIDERYRANPLALMADSIATMAVGRDN